MKYTDYSKVQELAINLLTEDKRLIELTTELEAKLQTLNASFLDDGIDEVNGYVGGLKAKIGAAQESIMIVVKELQEYANLLEQGKGR